MTLEMDRKQAVGTLSGDQLRSLVGSWDVVGDLAIVVIPEEFTGKEGDIGEAILRSNRKLRVVAKKEGVYRGEFRTVALKILAGEQRTETETGEYGVRLRLNPEKVYYSVRSSSERYRIATLVKKGEQILVPFSGIGPYPLVIARCASPAMVTGIEKNPVAHDYAVTNLALNKKIKQKQTVRFLCGDILETLPRIPGFFDRIIMPLPTAGEPFLQALIDRLSPGGWLHYYSMEKQGALDSALKSVAGAATVSGRHIMESSLHKTGHCAPRTYRICVDVKIA